MLFLGLTIAINTTQKVNQNTVINNLVTTQQGFVLDARQGKVMQDEINTINNGLALTQSAITITDTANYFASSLGLVAKKRGNIVTLYINVYTNSIFNGDVSKSILNLPVGFFPSNDIVDSANFSVGNYDFGASGYLFVGSGGGIILANTSGNANLKYCHKVITYVQ